MISCRSLAGCLRKIRDKGLMKRPHTPGVEHRIHTDNLLTHSCPPPFFCPGLHNHGCNICVPIHTDAGRKTPCRTPDKSLTTLFSSFPALDECCSILTGIPVSRTFSVCLYDSVQWLYRTEDRRKTPCPLCRQYYLKLVSSIFHVKDTFLLSQFLKIVPIKTAYLRYAVCGCCLCIKNANYYKYIPCHYAAAYSLHHEVLLRTQLLHDLLHLILARIQR